MTITFVNLVLLGMMVVVAVSIARTVNLFAAIMMMSMFSLLSASIFVVLDAVDVALTEAAVGACISTVLALGTLALTKTRESCSTGRPLLALLTVVITGGALMYGTLDMPYFGDPGAPIHQHVAPRYLQDSAGEVGPPNVVTSILASYRGYDTLGEVTVIFTAGIAVFGLIGRGRKNNSKTAPAAEREE